MPWYPSGVASTSIDSVTAPAPARTAVLTAATLVAFASNSLLCRAALGPRLIDAASFTTIRLLSGAVVLGLLARTGARADRPVAPGERAGSWASAAALFAYAATFSYAYLRISASVGALILFGAVQVTMVGYGLVRGEHPHASEWIGLVLAICGLALLTVPGTHAIDPLGALLMACAGAAWGVYSLRGRSARQPVAANAVNFAYCLPLCALLSIAFVGRFHIAWHGVALAVASGAIASGVGYSLWYAALRGLRAVRAAIVQLAVPVLTAAGAIALLGEHVTFRFLAAAVAVLGGVALAIAGHLRAAPRA